MTLDPTDIEIPSTVKSESTVENLWNIFEATGSVDAYLTYLRKVEDLRRKKAASIWPS